MREFRWPPYYPRIQHANLGITSQGYLRGIDSSEMIYTVHSRPAPVISATAGLRSPTVGRGGAADGNQETRRPLSARSQAARPQPGCLS